MVDAEAPISMKLVIIGDGAVGKTSLLLTYINKGFPRKYNPTVVDNYQASLKVGRRQLHLDIWDTAGQEDFENIRTLSYPGTDVVIACYSTVARSSLDNIQTAWIPEMRKSIPKTPFVLVGTKADLMDKMKALSVSEQEAANVCKTLKGYDSIQCSALLYEHKGRSNVDSAFKLAITCGLHQMHVGAPCSCSVL